MIYLCLVLFMMSWTNPDHGSPEMQCQKSDRLHSGSTSSDQLGTSLATHLDLPEEMVTLTAFLKNQSMSYINICSMFTESHKKSIQYQ